MSPQIDVSWVLDNPMFNDVFYVLRTPILSSGQPDTQNQIVLTVTGVVEIGTVDSIVLQTDEAHTAKSINIHTRTRLYDVMTNFDPDIVVYNGNQYKVTKVYDYSRYGSGFYAVDAEITDLATASVYPSRFTNPSVFRIGVNLSGLEDGYTLPGTAGVDFAIPTNTEISYAQSWGAAYIRLPFIWDRIQPTVLGALDPTYLGYIQGIVSYGQQIGLPVLLDLHSYGGRSINGVGHKLGDGTLTNAMFADVWTKLATMFAGNTGDLGYDLMNEPNDMPNSAAWPAAAQAAVTAIRLIDPATPIYIEGDNYSSAGSWLSVNQNLNISDPSNNLIYSAHCYFDRDSSGIYPGWVTENGVPLASPPNAGQPHTVEIGVQRVTQFFDWLAQTGFRGHIGEGGIAVDQNTNPANTTAYNPNYLANGWNVCLDLYLTYLQQNNIPFTYWNAGPYSGGYFLGIEPSVLNGITVDKPQVAVLRKYTGIGWNAGQATFTGTTRGQPSVASSAFTIFATGYYTEPQTFTLTTTDPAGTWLYNGETVTQVMLSGEFNLSAAVQYVPGPTPFRATLSIICPQNIVLASSPIGFSTEDDIFLHLAAQPRNIFSPDLIYTPYNGPLEQVYLSTDTAFTSPQNFYPTLLAADNVTNTVDQSAIQAFAGNSGRALMMDQSPNAYNQTIVTLDNQNGPTIATTVNGITTYSSAPLGPQITDLPLIVFNAQNNKPVLNRTNSRVDAPSPLSGQTAFGWFFVGKPIGLAGLQNFFGWQYIDLYAIAGDASGDWGMRPNGQPQATLTLDADPNAFHSYSGSYDTVAGIWQVYRDGILVASGTPQTTPINYEYRSNLRIGYAPFSTSYSAIYDAELIIFDRALTTSDHRVLHASAQARWGTPIPPAQVTGLTLGTTTYNSQVLSWNTVSGSTGYTVQYRLTGSTAWTPFSTGLTATSSTVTGLSSLTGYDFQVIALNGYGVGPGSAIVSVTTLIYPAGAGVKFAHIGVNLSGMENNPYPITPAPSQISYYLSKGFTIFRVPFDQRQAMPVIGGSLNAGYMANLDSTVAAINAGNGIAILDAHNYGTMAGQLIVASNVAQGATSITFTTNPDAFTTGATLSGAGIANGCTITSVQGNPTVTLSTATTAAISAGATLTAAGSIGTTVTNAAFCSFWSAIALRYVNNPLVRFDFQNEPGVGTTTWQGSLIAVAAAVRSVETAASVTPHVIYYPFPGSNAGSAAVAGVAFIDAIIAADTAGRQYRRFEFHQYFDSNGSGISGTVASPTVVAERCDAIINILRICGEQGFLGEFAWGADGYSGAAAGALAAGANGLAYWGQNADVLPEICWWGGGDFSSVLNNGYYYGIQPYNGQDTPFIAQLKAYLPGGMYYGYQQQVAKYPLTMANNNYVAASSSIFGQATAPNNWGSEYGNTAFHNVEFYVRARFTLPTNATFVNGDTVYGGDGYVGGFGVDQNGYLKFINGSSSTIRINDGSPHTVEYGVKNGLTYLFHNLDGDAQSALALTGSSSLTDTNGSPGFSQCVGNYKKQSYIWPGTIEYVEMYGNCLYTAAHAPLVGAPSLYPQPGRIVYWALDGNGNGLA